MTHQCFGTDEFEDLVVRASQKPGPLGMTDKEELMLGVVSSHRQGSNGMTMRIPLDSI
jgi:hypothetical protein